MRRNISPKNYQRLRPGRTVLSCSVDADIWHWLHTQADAAGVPVSQYLSQLVRQQIASESATIHSLNETPAPYGKGDHDPPQAA